MKEKTKVLIVIAIICIIAMLMTVLGEVLHNRCPECNQLLWIIDDTWLNELTMEYGTEMVEPTCAREGGYDVLCKKCGAVVKHVSIAQLEHQFVGAPSKTEGEYRYYFNKCKSCGIEVLTEKLHISHTYNILESISNRGVIYKCTKCNSTQTYNFKSLVGVSESSLPYTSRKQLSTTGYNYYYYDDVQVCVEKGKVRTVNY